MQEGRDYIITPEGLLTFTALYLKERGYCCGNGCLNCPWNYERVPEPRRTQLQKKRAENERTRKTT
jgi:hypothetical protein